METSLYSKHFYRNSCSESFEAFTITEGESNLWIGWNHENKACYRSLSAEIKKTAAEKLKEERFLIKEHIKFQPLFLSSLEPIPMDKTALPIIRAMLEAGIEAGVGPMAAVAGALAESLGNSLLSKYGLSEVLVENGGDIWLCIKKPITLGVYAGLSSLSGTFGIKLEPGSWGLACSSATVGPALSFGQADAAIALCKSGAMADAWATALGNASVSRSDPSVGINAIWNGPKKPLAALVICAERLHARGSLQFVPLIKNAKPY
ncbi:UPF0280 family protein [Spirochaetota bacterium]